MRHSQHRSRHGRCRTMRPFPPMQTSLTPRASCADDPMLAAILSPALELHTRLALSLHLPCHSGDEVTIRRLLSQGPLGKLLNDLAAVREHGHPTLLPYVERVMWRLIPFALDPLAVAPNMPLPPPHERRFPIGALPHFLSTPLGQLVNSARLACLDVQALRTLQQTTDEIQVARWTLYALINEGMILPLLVDGRLMLAQHQMFITQLCAQHMVEGLDMAPEAEVS